MDFTQSRKYLLEVFRENSFFASLQYGKTHVSQVIIDTCENNTKISVSFPGYKAHYLGNKVVYDYRVDIVKAGVTTALSHANIITDIYNKVENGGMSPAKLREVLVEFSKHGEIDLKEAANYLSYNSVPPSPSLISRVGMAHGNKVYNSAGNSFDLSIEELFVSIKWIVLQEDINYPIEKNFQGRKMPFSRYLEAIFVTQHASHSLEEVIGRALAHYRPRPWPEMDYSFTKHIK